MAFGNSIKTLALAGLVSLALAGECLAQSGTLGLRNIVHGTYDKPGDPAKPPDDMYASSRGGYLEVTLVHSDKTADRLWASWEFDRDIATVRAGDEIGMTLKTGIHDGNSTAIHYWISAVNLHAGNSNLMGQRKLQFKDWHPALIDGSVAFAYARKGYGTPVGRLDGKLTVYKHLDDYKGKTTGFLVKLNATANGSSEAKPTSGHYEWLYLYDVDGPASPNVEVKIGTPNVPDNLRPNPAGGRTPGSSPSTAKKDDSATPGGRNTAGSNNGGSRNPGGATANPGRSGDNNSGDNRPTRPPFNDDIIKTFPELPKGLPADVARGTILQANRVRVKEGETVRLRVDLWNAANISNMNFIMKYDGSVAQPTGKPIKGSLLSDVRLEANAGDRSGVLVGFADESGVSGTGSVVYVPFQAVGIAGDRTDVPLQITTVNDPTGGVPSVYEIPGEILIVDENGFPPGDSNGDGEVNELDALDALKMSVKLIPVQRQADIDKNGEVTSRDATLIMQRVREGGAL